MLVALLTLPTHSCTTTVLPGGRLATAALAALAPARRRAVQRRVFAVGAGPADRDRHRRCAANPETGHADRPVHGAAGKKKQRTRTRLLAEIKSRWAPTAAVGAHSRTRRRLCALVRLRLCTWSTSKTWRPLWSRPPAHHRSQRARVLEYSRGLERGSNAARVLEYSRGIERGSNAARVLEYPRGLERGSGTRVL